MRSIGEGLVAARASSALSRIEKKLYVRANENAAAIIRA
jgi:hypothetical protein